MPHHRKPLPFLLTDADFTESEKHFRRANHLTVLFGNEKVFGHNRKNFRFEAFRSIEEVSRQSVPGVKKVDVFLDQPACSWASNRESRWILIINVDQYFQKSRWRYLEQILETAHRVNPANEMRTRKNNSGHRR